MADDAAQGAQAYAIRQESLNKAQLAARATLAYNALSKVYGPIAGDPDSAIKMQEYGQREQTNPIAVQQAQANLTGTNLENTGRGQTNALNEALNPEKIAQVQETTREQPQVFQSEQAQRAAQTKQAGASTTAAYAQAAHTQTETQVLKFGLNEQQNAIAGRVLGSLTSVRDSGGDVSAAFNNVAPTLVKLGVMSGDHATALGTAIRAKPEVLDQLSAAMGYGAGAKGMTMVPASDDPRVMVSVPTSSLPKSQPGVQYTMNRQTGAIEAHAVTGSPQAQKYSQNAFTINQDIEKARYSYNISETRADAVHQNILQAMQFSSAAGLNAYNPLYGSQSKQLHNALESVKSDVVSSIIQNFKDSTPKGQASGVGRVMQAEIKLWTEAYASVEQSSTPTTLRYNLQRLDGSLSRLRAANQAYYKAVYGFDAAPAGAPGGGLPGGFTYLGLKK